MTSGHPAEAAAPLAALERALRDHPGDPFLLSQACEAALHGAQPERAALHLATAERLGFEGADWAQRAARVALARQDWAGALQALTQLRRLTGDQPQVAHDIAQVLLRLGDPAACREQLEPWLAAGETVADATIAAGMQCLWLRAAHALGLLRQARDWADALQSQGRLSPAAAGVASLVCVDLGDFARGKAQAKLALAHEPPVPEALVARATVALAEREAPAAVRWLTRALHADPHDGRTWATLAMANLQAGDAASARAQFCHATRLLPTALRIWQGLGWTCLLLGDPAGALAAFHQALALDGEAAEALACVGLVLLLTGRVGEAEQHLARAEQLHPDNATVRHARLLARGQPQDPMVFRALAARLLRPPGFLAAGPAAGART